jgi:anti-anti-sigma factor
MRLAVETHGEAQIARVEETKLTYPVLSSFFADIRQLVEDGARRVLIDLSAVSYVDSASIGCLMDIHRLLQDASGTLRLSGLQPRVETMLSMTGVHRIIDIHKDEAEALAAFGRADAAAGTEAAAKAGDDA